MRRAEHLLGACLLAALCGCAALPGAQREAPTATGAEPAQVLTSAVTAPPVHETAAPVLPPQNTLATAPARSLELLREAEQFAGRPAEQQRHMLAEAEASYDLEPTPLALVRYALLQSMSGPDRQLSAETAARLRDMLAVVADPADRDLNALTRLLVHVLDEREHLLAQNMELQRKLNQLKAIEQQLGDREGAETPPLAP